MHSLQSPRSMQDVKLTSCSQPPAQGTGVTISAISCVVIVWCVATLHDILHCVYCCYRPAALAENVFEGVKAKMRNLRAALAQKENLVQAMAQVRSRWLLSSGQYFSTGISNPECSPFCVCITGPGFLHVCCAPTANYN